jgi:hypothetical protein
MPSFGSCNECGRFKYQLSASSVSNNHNASSSVTYEATVRDFAKSWVCWASNCNSGGGEIKMKRHFFFRSFPLWMNVLRKSALSSTASDQFDHPQQHRLLDEFFDVFTRSRKVTNGYVMFVLVSACISPARTRRTHAKVYTGDFCDNLSRKFKIVWSRQKKCRALYTKT